MDDVDRPLTREQVLRRGAAGAVGLVAGGGLAQRALAAELGGVTLNWLTWSDHYFTTQLTKVKSSTQVGGRVQLISDDADAYIRVAGERYRLIREHDWNREVMRLVAEQSRSRRRPAAGGSVMA